MKKLLTFLFSLFYFVQLFAQPPNPTPPPFNGTLLPIVLTNDSQLDDSQVFFVITGSYVNTTTQVFMRFDDAGVGTLVTASTGDNAFNYSRPLSDFPTYPGALPNARVCYVPQIDSSLAFFSLSNPLDMPVNGNAIVQPSPTNPADKNYGTIYQTFEFVYLPQVVQISADLTAIAYFSLPIYAYLSTPTDQTTGLFQARSFIMNAVMQTFADNADANTLPQWNNLFLRQNTNILRILGTGQAMAITPTPLFDPNYLDNAAAYGYSFIQDIWSGPNAYYKNNTLTMTIPSGSLETYTGNVDPVTNEFVFTSSPSGYTVVFPAPNTNATPPNLTTTMTIFEGQNLWTIDTSGMGDGQQVSKLFEEAIIAGLIPTTDTLSNPYLEANQDNYFKVNPNLSPAGQTTGPWYDLYSKALHALGAIYTFSFDEPLFPEVQIQSANYVPNSTYLGLRLGPSLDSNYTITTVTSSQNPANVNAPVTINAKVTGLIGTPTGSVLFTVDGVEAENPVPLVNGVASFTTSTLTAGDHSIIAMYQPDLASDYLSSTFFPAFQQTILPPPQATTTTVTSSVNPANVNQQITFTATVDSASGTPTGSIVFNVDGTDLNPIALTNGSATLQTSFPASGSHTIIATYTSNNTTLYLSSVSPAFNQMINSLPAQATTTTVSASNNPVLVNTPVAFFATVTAASGTPTGTVIFTIDGVAGNPINLVNGKANTLISFTTAGEHTVTAAFTTSNPSAFQSSISEDFIEFVLPAAQTTTTTLTSSMNPTTQNTDVTLTANVTSAIGTPVGNVIFTIDGNPSAPVALIDGSASLTTSFPAVGNYNITAAYTSSNLALYMSSVSAPLVQIVNATPPAQTTTTIVTSTENPVNINELVTFNANVTAASGTPTGTVIFTIDGVMSTPRLVINGTASITTSFTTAGIHSITATYTSNNANLYLNSVSQPFEETVTAAPPAEATTTLISSSLNPAAINQLITFTAVVNAATGTPTGSIIFTIDGTALNPINLNAGTAFVTTSFPTAGNHVITAAYTSDNLDLYASSVSAPLIEIINGDTPAQATTTLVTSSANPAFDNQIIKLTATVSAAEGTPTGSIIFNVNGVVSNPIALVNGVATYKIGPLAPGSYDIAASYTPSDALVFQPSVGVLTQTINANNQNVLPPRDARGEQVLNKFATQTDVINVITWKAPRLGTSPVLYKIYKDAELNDLVENVKANPIRDRYEVKEHNQNSDKKYTYYIVSIDAQGNRSVPAIVVINHR